MFQEDRLLGKRVSGQISCLPWALTSKSKIQAYYRRHCAVGLEGAENKPVSGGQETLHFAPLFANADILLFDEPLKGLDEALKRSYCLCQTFVESKVVIWVTHTPEEVKLLGSYTALRFIGVTTCTSGRLANQLFLNVWSGRWCANDKGLKASYAWMRMYVSRGGSFGNDLLDPVTHEINRRELGPQGFATSESAEL